MSHTTRYEALPAALSASVRPGNSVRKNNMVRAPDPSAFSSDDERLSSLSRNDDIWHADFACVDSARLPDNALGPWPAVSLCRQRARALGVSRPKQSVNGRPPSAVCPDPVLYCTKSGERYAIAPIPGSSDTVVERAGLKVPAEALTMVRRSVSVDHSTQPELGPSLSQQEGGWQSLRLSRSATDQFKLSGTR
jgi:hypothetical protein